MLHPSGRLHVSDYAVMTAIDDPGIDRKDPTTHALRSAARRRSA
jgi:hypothetical protein